MIIVYQSNVVMTLLFYPDSESRTSYLFQYERFFLLITHHVVNLILQVMLSAKQLSTLI